MRRAFTDLLMSIGAITIVLMAILAIDSQLREKVALQVAQTKSPTELVDVGSRARRAVIMTMQVVKAEGQQHTTLMMFVVAATVLTVFLLRT